MCSDRVLSVHFEAALRMRSDSVGSLRHQGGIALLAMLTLLTLWGLYLFVGQLSATQLRAERERNAAAALAEAKAALIGDAVARLSLNDTVYLRLPDLGTNIGSPAEGYASGIFSGDERDLSVLGKFPWKTLDIAPLRDRYGECLWYVVSGRFKVAPKTKAPMNWDTQGQIDVIDGTGKMIATNLAALIAAPGQAVDRQDRTLANAAYSECGGNYDARNYLDTFDSINAVGSQVNYFSGSMNNRVALDGNNKTFVMTNNDHYNDRFLFATVNDVFDPIIKRADFAAAIRSLLDDSIFQEHLNTIPVSGSKGTDKLNCYCNTPGCTEEKEGNPFQPFQAFCKNWREMLFLTELSVPSKITVDGELSAAVCARILIFAGRKTASQSRSDDTRKTDKTNYLENTNLSSFEVPLAASANFAGASVFNWRTPSSDLVRCLPSLSQP